MDTINAVGRRKTAVARVYLREGDGKITVNGRDYKDYFPTAILQYTILTPLETANATGRFDITVNVDGGGFKGQAEALSLGISRALIETDAELRPPLKAKGLLMRDPRMVERKKPGQKKARKRFQFSKR